MNGQNKSKSMPYSGNPPAGCSGSGMGSPLAGGSGLGKENPACSGKSFCPSAGLEAGCRAAINMARSNTVCWSITKAEENGVWSLASGISIKVD